jgi:4-carboxymuconolactone decarboxylase
MGESYEEAQRMLALIHEKRGYVLDFHKVLAAEDLPFLQALTQLQDLAHMSSRRLDRKTKELAFVAALVASGGAKEHLARHMGWAKDAGATKEEMLELLEMLVAPCGVPRFMHAFEVWREAYAPNRMELAEASKPAESR